MHFLVVDTRFTSPVYVFLEQDPEADRGFPPGLDVRHITLETDRPDARGQLPGVGMGTTVGQNPGRADRYRVFGSDGAAERAGYGLVEPRFVGQSWAGYSRVFRYGAKRLGSDPSPHGRRKQSP
jgi:hypothetical protein